MEGKPDSARQRGAPRLAVGFAATCWLAALVAAALLAVLGGGWRLLFSEPAQWVRHPGFGMWLVLGTSALAASGLALLGARFIRGGRVPAAALVLTALAPLVAGAVGRPTSWWRGVGWWITGALPEERSGILASMLAEATRPVVAALLAAGILVALLAVLALLGRLISRPGAAVAESRELDVEHARARAKLGLLLAAAVTAATLLLGSAGVEQFRQAELARIQALRPEDRFLAVAALLRGLRARWVLTALATTVAAVASAVALMRRPRDWRLALGGRRRGAVGLAVGCFVALAAPHVARAVLDAELRRSIRPFIQVETLPGLELPREGPYFRSRMSGGERLLVMTLTRSFYLRLDDAPDLQVIECVPRAPDVSLAVDRRVRFGDLIDQLRFELERNVYEYELVTRRDPARDSASLGGYAALAGPELSGTHVSLVPDLGVALRGDYVAPGRCSCRRSPRSPSTASRNDEPKAGVALLALLDDGHARTRLWPGAAHATALALGLDRATVLARADRLAALKREAPAMCRLVIAPRPGDSIERVVAAVEAFRPGYFSEVVVSPARESAEALAAPPSSSPAPR